MDVVRRAASGEIVMSDDELPIVLDELRTGREPTVVAELALRRLTARETEILRALASCEATGEIADELGISPLTVQSHVKSIPAKLGVHSQTEARAFALRHQLIPLDPLVQGGFGIWNEGESDPAVELQPAGRSSGRN